MDVVNAMLDGELAVAIDDDGNRIAVGEGWAYISETGMMLSEYLADGSLREDICGEKKKIEMLYLLPNDIKPEEHNRIKVFPLPLSYNVGQIVCQNHVFTVSSKVGNPPVCGAFEVIEEQLTSAARSYYTRGLASNVLERYYYEFLVERHQLYLEQELLKREMKERKKSMKKHRHEKITEESFHKDKSGKYLCEQKIKLWGVTTTLYANFKECSENGERTLKKYACLLNSYILWIEKHKKEIEQELLRANMAQLARNWMEGREVSGEEGKAYYELENGELIPFPITDERFLESLFIESIHIDSDTFNTARIHLFLGTAPDFFACHSIAVFIDIDIDCSGNINYEFQVGGLEG
ncbi:MAG: DUF2262 domain-containing protein [bacterium]|nr:DUF2262 domain-containing protein [bacterium]MCM1376519.1 DUF2262 domain-containing protein [Muribaculum sp.]MCM1410829.1 DUF2262 domain-containing protein [Lachnospiraceae bacterium]